MKLPQKFLSLIFLCDTLTIVIFSLFYFFLPNFTFSVVELMILGIIFAFFNICLLVALNRNIFSPLGNLANLAEQFLGKQEKGDKKLVEENKDEIEKLSVVFHDLQTELEEKKQEEVKLVGKTHELEKKVEDLEPKYTTFSDTKRAMLNIMEDLQEEKSKVEIEKARDEAIITSIGEGLVATNPEGKLVFVNPVAEEMLGVNKNSIGKLIYDAIPIEDDQGNQIEKEQTPAYVTLHEQRKMISNSFKMVGKSRKFNAGITATPVILNKKAIGAIIVFRDITKEREIDRMKTEFISLASHQLRTPLSAIKWFGEMLINGDAGKLSKEQMEMTSNIAQSTERMIALVSSLLNISRIESGRIIIDPKPTSLQELINEVVIDVDAKLKEKKHKLVVDVDKKLPKISIDPHLVRHVYMNLLTNAIKYTPDSGEINIKVYVKKEDVISEVSDTGYGIPEKEFPKMFQKFFRAENIIKVETDGTGLGLYLVKAIVESSGGRIWFESKVNKGTTFWFTLPLKGSKAKKGEVTIDS
jgi:PAS domain S-box-containing protein